MGNRDVSKPNNDGESCDDVISRQAVLDIVNNPLNIRLDEIIKKLPPVTPQPKTGHWMIVEDSIDRFFTTYECSCCKRAIIVQHDAMKGVYKDYPYCHCGAKMVEPRKARQANDEGTER